MDLFDEESGDTPAWVENPDAEATFKLAQAQPCLEVCCALATSLPAGHVSGMIEEGCLPPGVEVAISNHLHFPILMEERSVTIIFGPPLSGRTHPPLVVFADSAAPPRPLRPAPLQAFILPE